MGWAQHNLTAETRDRIARTLFVVQQEDGDWLNGLCPFHDDRTMSFGYNVTDDVFKCFASCTDSGDLVDLWCRVKGYPCLLYTSIGKQKRRNNAPRPLQGRLSLTNIRTLFRQYVTASHGRKARGASVAETRNAAILSSVGRWRRLRQAL